MKEHFRDSDRRFWQCRLMDATVGCQVLAALEKRQFRNVSATSPPQPSLIAVDGPLGSRRS
ncbi:MAG: hypothetical protein WCD04_01420 [Terriglobia bacterium]